MGKLVKSFNFEWRRGKKRKDEALNATTTKNESDQNDMAVQNWIAELGLFGYSLCEFKNSSCPYACCMTLLFGQSHMNRPLFKPN